MIVRFLFSEEGQFTADAFLVVSFILVFLRRTKTQNHFYSSPYKITCRTRPFYGTGVLFVLLAHTVHSQWLALPCGMDFRCCSDFSPGFILTLRRKLDAV